MAYQGPTGWGASFLGNTSASYQYGYGGCRQDFPATGFNQEYNPAPSSSSWRSTYETGSLVQRHDPEQYNPVYPSYNGTRNTFARDVFPSSAQQGLYSSSHLSGNRSIEVPTRIVNFDPNQNINSLSARKTFPAKKKDFQKKQRPGKTSSSVPEKPLQSVPAKKPGSNTIRKKPVSKAGVNSPNQAGKVARVKKNTGTKKPTGVVNIKTNRKMPNYQGLTNTGGWGGNWTGNSGQQNGGGQRGFGGRGRRGRGGRGGFRGRGPPKPANSKDDIPFVALAETAPAINMTVSPDNIVAFHGFDSVFTTQHSFPVLIDGKIYESCDHYYQIRKVTDLCGNVSEKLADSVRDETGKRVSGKSAPAEKSKQFSSMAREQLKAGNVEKEKVDEWRNTKGLEAVQKSLLAKVSQSAHLREALKETGEAILVHAYAGDSIYGTGCTVPKIKKWLEELEKTGVKSIKIPSEFPLNEKTVQNCPAFAQGRNILGVILMQLREKVNKNQVKVVDMSTIFNALRTNDHAEDAMDTGIGANGFHIGGGDIQQKLGTF